MMKWKISDSVSDHSNLSCFFYYCSTWHEWTACSFGVLCMDAFLLVVRLPGKLNSRAITGYTFPLRGHIVWLQWRIMQIENRPEKWEHVRRTEGIRDVGRKTVYWWEIHFTKLLNENDTHPTHWHQIGGVGGAQVNAAWKTRYSMSYFQLVSDRPLRDLLKNFILNRVPCLFFQPNFCSLLQRQLSSVCPLGQDTNPLGFYVPFLVAPLCNALNLFSHWPTLQLQFCAISPYWWERRSKQKSTVEMKRSKKWRLDYQQCRRLDRGDQGRWILFGIPTNSEITCRGKVCEAYRGAQSEGEMKDSVLSCWASYNIRLYGGEWKGSNIYGGIIRIKEMELPPRIKKALLDVHEKNQGKAWRAACMFNITLFIFPIFLQTGTDAFDDDSAVNSKFLQFPAWPASFVETKQWRCIIGKFHEGP